jgi:2-methylcitrate dehydratase PrpD
MEQRYPAGRPARITLRLHSGATLSEFMQAPSGDVSRPLDDAALERKFLLNAAEMVGEKRADEIVQCVKRLEQLDRVSELTRLLAAS